MAECSIFDYESKEVYDSISKVKTKNYSISQMKVKEFWKQGYTGMGIRVGIIDSGCDYNHEALKNKVITGENFTDDDAGNYYLYNDYEGHGTHVAGIIAADNMGNGKVMGIAPDVELVIAKALNKNGRGTYDNIVKAIQFCIDNKCDIINMSLGGSSSDSRLEAKIKEAVYDKNIAVVVASGNDAKGDDGQIDEINYPAYYEPVISVGALDKDFHVAKFSNSNKYVDIIAAGKDIISTYKDNTYTALDGTSMACPQISGILALLKQKFKVDHKREPSESELYAQLVNYCREIKGVNYYCQGNGFVDLSLKKRIKSAK